MWFKKTQTKFPQNASLDHNKWSDTKIHQQYSRFSSHNQLIHTPMHIDSELHSNTKLGTFRETSQ